MLIIDSDKLISLPLVRLVTSHATSSFLHKKAGANGNLSYVINGQLHSFDLWINILTQNHALEGTLSQGKLSNHFYPKSYTMGDYELTVICSSQLDFQNLGVFVRKHHETLMDHQGGFDVLTANAAQSSKKFKKLLHLTIPSEAINCYGYCPNIHITRKGVFEPNPEYPLTFTPVYDKRSADFKISQKVIGWFPNPKTETGLLTTTPTPAKKAISLAKPSVPFKKNLFSG